MDQIEDVKPVTEELLQQAEKEVAESSQPNLSQSPLKDEEKSPELDVIKLFTRAAEVESPASLYDQLKAEPEALTLLAPAAGDAVISLDFSCPGLWPHSAQASPQQNNPCVKPFLPAFCVPVQSPRSCW